MKSEKRRAISPMLSIMILMGVALVGGGVLYGIQNQVFVAGLSSTELMITELKIEMDKTGSCYLGYEISNSGTESIKSIFLKITMDSGDEFLHEVNIPSGNFSPGDSPLRNVSKQNITLCQNLTLSEVYSVQINAKSADSSFSMLEKIKIKNVTTI